MARVRELSEVFFGRNNVGFVCGLLGIKGSEPDILAAHRYNGTPWPPGIRAIYTFERRLSSFPSHAVSRVLGIVCLSQIVPSIVKTVSIFVVDERFRPLSGHVEPRQAMRSISAALDPYNYIVSLAALLYASCLCASKSSVPAFVGPGGSWLKMPQKYASVRIVTKKPAEFCCCNHIHHIPKVSIGYKP